jgi:hypothetical protein
MQRVRDIGDIRLAIDGAFETPQADAPATAPPRRWWQRPVPAGLAALLTLVAFAVWASSRSTPPARFVTRFPVTPPENVSLGGTGRGNFLAVSPDGRFLVYIAGGRQDTSFMSEVQCSWPCHSI